ncbi:MAG: multiheme c-type cytochrome [Pyrinomonadaceae bacterium]
MIQNSLKKFFALAALALCAVVCLWSPRALHGQDQTQGNSPLSKWRPSHEAFGIRYVGSNACAQCHTQESANWSATPMAHALETVADCEVLKKNTKLSFRNGAYSYQITRQGNRSIYTVSDGDKEISEPILYCFGQGVVGQTYVFRHNGALYESRISYYPGIRNMDFTTGHLHTEPASLEDALGRVLSPSDAQGCFSCHSTAAVSGSQLQLDKLTPGVACEACHGPGEKHLAAVRAKDFKSLQIFNPGKLDAFDLMQEFCGSCHRSFDNVMLMPGQGGINNIRFQPYRIFNSPGHFKNDPRISCTACHNPHDKLEHDTAFYDSKCLACHLTSVKEAKTERRNAPACPVSRQQCASCHMPKVLVPETHAEFTDHWIRIVKPDSPVPN